jgi:hypothetical protein
MITTLMIVVALFQGPGRLQPGAGIVMGTIQFQDGGAAAGVRVGALAVDDPSSMISVAETDGDGKYRLINIPAGKYFIVAGRLNSPSYFPAGTDQAKATAVNVEAAKITGAIDFSVPSGSKRPVAPQFTPAGSDPGTAAYRAITAEKRPDVRKKLLLDFERNYPKSTRIAEIYIDLSRTFASQTDFRGAKEYAEKAVGAVARLKAETPPDFTPAWHSWVASLEKSARDNLAWTTQMVDWQQKQLNKSLFGRR